MSVRPRLPALVLLVLWLVAPASPALARQTAGASIHAASEYDYPPFATLTAEGKADGFAVQLLRAAANAMGSEATFDVGPWHVIKQELADGKLDVLPLVARTRLRDLQFDFSFPYLSMHGAIVVRKGDTHIHGPADLRWREVVVMRGDIAEEYVQEHRLTERMVTVESLELGLRRLARGHYDAMVVQKLAAQNLINSLGLNNLTVVGEPLTDYQEFCFAVREGDKELLSTLNEGLALVIADGTFARLQKQWLGPINETGPFPVIPVALTLVLAAVGASAWQRSLRRMVRVRTAELSRVNAQLAEEAAERERTQAELTRSAVELEDLYNRAPVGYHSVDAEGRIVRINDTELEWLGYRREEVVSRMRVQELLTPASRELFVRNFEEFKKSGYISDVEFEFVRKDGSRLPVLVSASAIADSEGHFLFSRTTVYDVTERKRIEQMLVRHREQLESLVAERTAALEAANRRLQRLNSELEQFAYVAAHDLKAPLRAVSHLANAVAEELDERVGESVREQLRLLVERTQRMHQLIDSMLAYARAASDESAVESVDVGQLVRELIEGLQPPHGMVIEIAPDLPTLKARRLHLSQVFANLIANAFKHHDDPGHAHVRIGGRRDADCWRFDVCDDGPGIEPQYRAGVFRMFQTLSRRGTDATGIGLAVVAKLVSENGGSIEVKGGSPRGACFSFLWPEQDAAD